MTARFGDVQVVFGHSELDKPRALHRCQPGPGRCPQGVAWERQQGPRSVLAGNESTAMKKPLFLQKDRSALPSSPAGAARPGRSGEDSAGLSRGPVPTPGRCRRPPRSRVPLSLDGGGASR